MLTYQYPFDFWTQSFTCVPKLQTSALSRGVRVSPFGIGVLRPHMKYMVFTPPTCPHSSLHTHGETQLETCQGVKAIKRLLIDGFAFLLLLLFRCFFKKVSSFVPSFQTKLLLLLALVQDLSLGIVT